MKFKHLKAVILDWAGTGVDFGSLAPVAALQKAFAEFGVEVTSDEVRAHMGLLKKDQIRQMCAGERVQNAWKKAHGRAPSEEDVSRIFADFLPKQHEILAEFSDPIPGAREAVETWKAGGLRIGSTTGYTRALLDVVIVTAAKQGYRTEASATPDEVGGGRPKPFMCYRNSVLLDIYPLSACVKIGDTPSDVAEGLNAGMWTIGITRTGNEVGLSEKDLNALPAARQKELEDRAAQRLKGAGAHFLARSLAECTAILEEIDAGGQRSAFITTVNS